MLMVIFGAGASYDSSPDFSPPSIPAAQQNFGNSPAQSLSREQWRPPLANNLFDNPSQAFSAIVRKYPKLSHILPLLRQRSGNKTVEEVLEQLQDESRSNPEGQRELATVQYYLRDLFFLVTNKWLDETDRTTNYSTLIRDILRLTKSGELVCLVTFNYDLLLDNALFSYDYKSRQPEDQFQSHPVLKLFKPHGSVDWARRVLLPQGDLLKPQGIIDEAEAIRRHLMSDFRRFNPSEADSNPGRQTFFPAIAIPVQNKTEETFVWPPNHVTQLQELLPSVTKILIIGWQAREAHFIELLRGSLPRVSHVMVVGSGPLDAAKPLEHFAESTALVKKASIDQAAIAGRTFSFKRDRIFDSMAYEGAVELSVAPGGFSDFALNRRIIDFLKG
jgi:hypothetical protein